MAKRKWSVAPKTVSLSRATLFKYILASLVVVGSCGLLVYTLFGYPTVELGDNDVPILTSAQSITVGTVILLYLFLVRITI